MFFGKEHGPREDIWGAPKTGGYYLKSPINRYLHSDDNGAGKEKLARFFSVAGVKNILRFLHGQNTILRDAEKLFVFFILPQKVINQTVTYDYQAVITYPYIHSQAANSKPRKEKVTK